MTAHEFPPFYNGIGAWLLSLRIHVPYILEIMHIPGYPRSAGFKERAYKKLSEAFLEFDAASAAAVRVINRTETPEFLVRAGVPREKLVYLPANYIDLDVFKPDNGAKDFDVIFIGRLAENKGIELFLDAVEQAQVSALIVGDGPLRAAVQRRLDGGLGARVKLHGWAHDNKEVAHLLNRAKVLVMPSYNEGGPRVVLEAMACGVPVVATRVGIVPDVVKDGETGYVADWDAGDIAQKIHILLGEHPSRFCDVCRAMAIPFERKAAIARYAQGIKHFIRV